MKELEANKGVVEPTPEERDAVIATLRGLRPVTGPQRIKNPKSLEHLIDAVLADPSYTGPPRDDVVRAVQRWWLKWRTLGHPDVRTEWPGPLSNEAISRMATSYNRTSSSPTPLIWNRIKSRPEFQNIVHIFQNVPHHRLVPENSLGWVIDLPWEGNQLKNLQLAKVDLYSALVKSFRATCVQGYMPVPLKIKGRRGGQQRVVTSVGQLTNTVPGSDPFGISISVPPHMTFYAYISTHFFIPTMWPTYTDWPSLKAAILAWQQQDLDALDTMLEADPELGGPVRALYVWNTLLCGWESLAVRVAAFV